MSVQFAMNNIPVDLLDIPQLMIVTDRVRPVDTFLLDRFFPNRLSFSKKEVPVGEIDTVTPLAPFVDPGVAGRQIKSVDSGKVKTVKPAYLKPKMSVVPSDVHDSALIARLRQTGVIATGSNALTPGELLLIDQIQKAQTIRTSIDNRKLLMARDCLLTGKMTFASDDFPTYTVDYERASACTFVPATKWDANGATPVADIEAMLKISVDQAGVSPTIALTSSKVFNALMGNDEFQERFSKPYAGISVPVQPAFNRTDTAQYRGNLDGIDFWTYDVSYRFSGDTGRFIPADYFGLIADTNGYLVHCMIQHPNAYGQPLEFFLNQWQDNDPGTIQMVGESSPLVVPNNKDGVVGGIGFVTL